MNDKDIARDIGLLGPAAAPFMPSLLARFDRVAGDREQRKALAGVFRSAGARAGPATSRLVTALRDQKQRYLQRETLAALSAIGPPPPAQNPRWSRCSPRTPTTSALEIVETLAAIDARLTRAEFEPLFVDYRKDCRRAGSIYMFNLGRDEDCYRRAGALERLARRAGHPFGKQDGESAGGRRGSGVARMTRRRGCGCWRRQRRCWCGCGGSRAGAAPMPNTRRPRPRRTSRPTRASTQRGRVSRRAAAAAAQP